MLKAEVIQANEILKELTPDQVKAIETLSANDEEESIRLKTGKIYGDLERDMNEFGLEKPEGWKSKDGKTQIYHFLKEEVYPKVKEYSSASGTIEDQKKKISELEEAIKNNAGDEALKTKLSDALSKLSAMETKVTETETTWKSKYEEKANEVTNLMVNSEFDKGLSGLKFKDEKMIPADIRNIAISNAKQSVMNQYDPDFIDAEDGSGKKVLVWRKKGSGEIARNPSNGLNPFTASELLMQDKGMKSIIDEGRQQPGSGSRDDDPGSGGEIMDLGQAKTQIQADEIIRQTLLKKGLTGVELLKEHDKVRKESGVDKLPMK